jgi:hypothetical protein
MRGGRMSNAKGWVEESAKRMAEDLQCLGMDGRISNAMRRIEESPVSREGEKDHY